MSDATTRPTPLERAECAISELRKRCALLNYDWFPCGIDVTAILAHIDLLALQVKSAKSSILDYAKQDARVRRRVEELIQQMQAQVDDPVYFVASEDRRQVQTWVRELWDALAPEKS